MARQGGKGNKSFNLGSLEKQDVLGHLANCFSAPVQGTTGLQMTVFEHRIAPESTTNKTFTDENPIGGNANTQVWGGYIKIEGANNAIEIDIGHGGDTDVFLDGATGNGTYGLLIADHVASSEDIGIVVASNSSTAPIKVTIALLSVDVVTG